MPHGTCKVCGCTDARACPGGCSWRDAAHEYCSQCVGWALLRDRGNLDGVFPYNVAPVLSVEPTIAPGPVGRPPKFAIMLDLRRVGEESLSRMATISAPLNGMTVEDFFEVIHDPGYRFPIAIEVVAASFEAPDLETVVRAAEEFRARGTVTGVRREDRVYAAVVPAHPRQPGGSRRG